MPQLTIGVKDAAASIGISPWTIRKLLRQGKLPFVRVGRRVLIEPSALERLIEAGRRQERT